MYCLNMLAIALELARENPAYEDVATKFFEHFVVIADAMNNIGEEGIGLWDEARRLLLRRAPLRRRRDAARVRSMVGLSRSSRSRCSSPRRVERLPFERRMDWFLETGRTSRATSRARRWPGAAGDGCSRRRRRAAPRVLRYMLDESEFLSPYGIRALSRYHADHPYVLEVNGQEHRVDYEPAESTTGSSAATRTGAVRSGSR